MPFFGGGGRKRTIDHTGADWRKTQDGRKEIKMENQETKWRMNLQLFAEDAPNGEGDEPQENGGSGGAAQTYTAEEVMKLIQHFVHLANAPIEDIKAAFSIVGNAHRYYAERR